MHFLITFLTLTAFIQAAQTQGPGPSIEKLPVAPLGGLLAKGDLGAATLKKYAYIGSNVLAKDQKATVYAGARAPVFQVVLWGDDKEKPDRVLIEFDPKKQGFEALEAFTADWEKHFKGADAKTSMLEAFIGDTGKHLKEYCGRLPPGARCEVRQWQGPAGRVLRADIHLTQGPPVPKAIEFERKKEPKPEGKR